MRATWKQIKKSVVETLSGTPIGHVTDIVFQTEGQEIIQYQVKPSAFRVKEYLISRDQIVRFEENKIIVYDTALPKELRKQTREERPLVSDAAGL